MSALVFLALLCSLAVAQPEPTILFEETVELFETEPTKPASPQAPPPANELERYVEALSLQPAGRDNFFNSDLNVQGKIELPWPRKLNRGYAPVNLQLANRSNKAVVAELSIDVHNSTYFNGAFSITGEQLESICVPVHYEDYNSLSLRINTVLEFNESYVYQSGMVMPMVAVLNPGSIESYPWLAASSIFSNEENAVAINDGTSLPLNPECYTSLNSVLWDARIELEPGVLGAISAWVRLGGNLIVLNAQQSTTNALKPWTESRFEEPLMDLQKLPSAHLSSQVAALLYNRVSDYTGRFQGFAGNKADISRFLMGRGSLTLVSGKSSLNDALRVYHMNLSNGDRSLLLHPSLSWQGDLTSGSYDFDAREPKNVEDWDVFKWLPDWLIPITGFFAAFLLGPVNLFWVSRRKDPFFIVVSTPIFSVLILAMIIAIAISSQVKNLRSAAFHITVLDQRNQTLDGVGHRFFLLTRSLVQPLTAKPGISLLPLGQDYKEDWMQEVKDKKRLYRKRYSQSRQVIGHWFGQHLSSRLQLKFSDTTVTNGLEVEIDRLWWKDPSGTLFSADNIPINGTGQLVKATWPAVEEWPSLFSKQDLWLIGELRPGTYWAQISALSDASSYEVDGFASKPAQYEHWIYGILPNDGGGAP